MGWDGVVIYNPLSSCFHFTCSPDARNEMDLMFFISLLFRFCILTVFPFPGQSSVKTYIVFFLVVKRMSFAVKAYR